MKNADQAIEIRPCKYLNNIIEQDHRYVKKKTRSALGFKAFYSAHATLQGIELIQMIRQGQVGPIPDGSLIEQFNYLAMECKWIRIRRFLRFCSSLRQNRSKP